MWRYRMVANPRSGLREVMFVTSPTCIGLGAAVRGVVRSLRSRRPPRRRSL